VEQPDEELPGPARDRAQDQPHHPDRLALRALLRPGIGGRGGSGTRGTGRARGTGGTCGRPGTG